jgi:Spy/CpxP family protein refolding chaperone
MNAAKIFSRTLAAATLVALCAAPALAQRGKWWQDEQFRRELSLTAEQTSRLEEIFQKHQPKLREHMRALSQAEEELNTLIEKGDDASVMAHMGVVEAARADLNKTRTLMLLRMRRSLTADQWAKFTALANLRNQQNRDSNRGQR